MRSLLAKRIIDSGPYKGRPATGSQPGGWCDRHDAAVQAALANAGDSTYDDVRAAERAVVLQLQGWVLYAEQHKERFESKVTEDYILGPPWKEIGLALRAQLNGELGRLDGGTLDAFILDTLADNGVKGIE